MKQTDTTKIEIENFLEVLEEFFEWCEKDYNIHYGTGIERRAKSKRENAKGKGIDVFKNGSFFKHYTNIISAARELCIHRSIISHRVNGKVKSDYKGLTFQLS